jgi:sigma-E factor negative regulatory protein RseA
MERISALMDGELAAQEVAGELKRVKQDPELRRTWETYHVIGDALRGQSVAADNFMAAFHARLETEPTVLAPHRSARAWLAPRVALPVAASVCGVAIVAWLTLYNNPFQPAADNVAANSQENTQIVVQKAPPAVMPAVAQVDDDYLLAHQEFSPRTAMQGVTSYVRRVPSPGVQNQ